MVLTDRTEIFVKSAAFVAVKSNAKQRTNLRNFASLMRERK